MAVEPYIGEVSIYAFNFAPQGWAQCNGQLLPISQYSALFALVGTYYGGDGHTTFALPDLRGRLPMHFGAGPGLTPRTIGERGGAEQVTLSVQQMPAHTHTATVTSVLHAETTLADRRNPQGAMLATPPAGAPIYAEPIPADDRVMASGSVLSSAEIAPAGGSSPVPTEPPFLALNFCIATVGVFPPRD